MLGFASWIHPIFPEPSLFSANKCRFNLFWSSLSLIWKDRVCFFGFIVSVEKPLKVNSLSVFRIDENLKPNKVEKHEEIFVKWNWCMIFSIWKLKSSFSTLKEFQLRKTLFKQIKRLGLFFLTSEKLRPTKRSWADRNPHSSWKLASQP